MIRGGLIFETEAVYPNPDSWYIFQPTNVIMQVKERGKENTFYSYIFPSLFVITFIMRDY